MKKAQTVKLSLRKLLIAMLAVGPLAILPSPVWAVLPTQSSITLQNGSATITQTGTTVATITSSDRAVIQWATAGGGNSQFNIGSGEVYNFQMPAGGAVLNRILTGETANIGGQLDSNGRVFVLAPGGTINVATGATITATGGLVLSTLAEENGAFLATGDLLFTPGTTNGSITIGGTTVTPISVGGNIKAVSGTITHGATSVTGDMILTAVNAGAAMNLTSAGGLLVGGNLTVSTNNGDIVQGAGGAITVGNTTAASQIATFNTGGNKSVTIDNANNDFQNIVLNAGTGLGGNVTIKDVNKLVLGNSTVGGNLTVTVKGVTTEASLTTTGAVNVVGDASYNNDGTVARTNINIGNNSTVGGNLAASATNNSSFTFTGLGNVTLGTLTSTGGNATGVTINVTGNVTANGTIATTGNATTGGGGISLRGANITQTATGILNAGGTTVGTTGAAGSVTLNATAGNITVGQIYTNRTLALTSTGSVSQLAGTSIVASNTTALTNTWNVTGSLVLDNAGNAIPGAHTVRITAGTANFTNTLPITLGTSNVTNNLNLVSNGAGAGITLGTGAGTAAEHINVGGVLAATVSTNAAGTITDNDYTRLTATGGLNLTTAGGGITIDGATAFGSLAPRTTFGPVNANAGTGAVSISESTPLNLGNITAASLSASSVEGIVDSGNLTVSGTATLSASNNSTIVLDNTNHSVGTLAIGGSTQASLALANDVTVSTAGSGLTGNLSVTTASGKNIVVTGASITGGLTLNSGGTINYNNAAQASISGNLSSSSQGATTQGGAGGLVVGGTASVMAANGNAVTLGGQNNFSTVMLNNSTGAVTINDFNDLAVWGNTTGLLTVTSGSPGANAVATTWNLSFGNLSVGSLAATAADAGGGRSGTITQQSGTAIHSEGATSFTTDDGNIVLTNAGNSFGALTITVGTRDQANTVNITEDGGMRIAGLNSRGTTTLTSRTGSIFENPDASVTFTNNGTLNLNAVAGSILLGNTTTRNGAFTTGGNLTTVNINAPTGAAAVVSLAGNGNITLGNVSANSLTVTANNIGQSQPARVFGAASFTANGNITLENVNNNFGRVSLNSIGGNATAGTSNNGTISIVEGGTLNLGSVKMGWEGNSTKAAVASAGNFTARSVNGDIIDTGLANLKLGGLVAATGVLNAGTVLSGTGVVTLTASNGNIVLDDPTTDFLTSGGVVFSGGNVTLAPLGNAPIYVGSANATSVAGNLTVTSAIGNILSAGNISVTGDAMFQTGNGNITLAQSGNKFGTLRFVGKQVAIVESDDTVLVTGSSAVESAQISSGGNITVSNKGGTINFNNTVFLSATGSITLPKVIQAVGTLTVNAAGTKDLSALSVASDLSGKNPVNLGTGTYIKPPDAP